MTSPRTHECPGGCGHLVADRLFACTPCWVRLPTDLKRPITFNRRGSEQHWVAMADAHRWYREQREARA